MLYEPPPSTSWQEQRDAEEAVFHKIYPHVLEAIRGLPGDSPWAAFFIRLERHAAKVIRDRPLRLVNTGGDDFTNPDRSTVKVGD